MSMGIIDAICKIKKNDVEKFNLKIGIIKSLEDKENKNRILVSFADEELEVWAIVMTFYVGQNKGKVSYPDVGTPCVVGFFDGDLQRPIILGYIYDNSQYKTILPLNKENKKELYITKSEINIETINEPDKLNFNIVTKKKHELNYKEEEETLEIKNQNSKLSILINFKESEIIINVKKLTIKGENDSLTFEDGKSLNFSSSSGKFEVSSSDSNINCKNSVNIKTDSGKISINGTGGAEVQTSANLILKGTMTQIN